ncbi:hypothetical protein ND861_10130 [Leptospira sp. 2 VSF19]|uniref:Porin n=1 Tax=Leptospira soteropolitanensis TaxID=2950025 RepID=A0AAW5VMS9_9LEPT|nr:hypothetical protein [Leptospira soteropolitanensis]MCW7492434.1 hypothetical protein [Leptospira soteropolitanensis]MCW7500485.1 hypothetical protein [Leptospira soteropolitanensis]MCW7522845.1 hypothetical protein [Leptospira soteropolitanensis]MCW7526704.1 hypothetical protein [Leptospira soteropolitanensis]MCW7530455.1 hypothetical protein [Leptospira soteropolitanensis]
MKKIPSSFFLLFVFYFLCSHVLWAQETKATNLELEAESYEERGYLKKAEELRSKVKRLREDQFRERNKGPNFPITSDIPATSNGSLVFNQGNWEVGFRGLSQFGVFTSGDESALDDGRIAFQAGSPYYPRSPIGYQNIRSLPFTYDIKNPYEISRSFSPRFAYKHKSAKWGLEYTFLQFQTTNDYLSFGFATVPLSALHSDRLYSAEHNLVVKIYEEYSKNIGYSWDFGLRAGSFHTNSVFSSQSLGQTGIMRDSIQYLAPSAGFRFYHKLGEGLSYDLGGALFVTPLGKLMYRREVLTQAGGFRRFGEGMIVSDEAYSLFSEKPIQTSITGIDLLGQFNWQPFEHHKFHLGLQIIQYIWRANESYAPGIRALNEESFYSGVRDYYLSSAFYEADGQNKRSSRNYLVSNLYFGYTYVF